MNQLFNLYFGYIKNRVKVSTQYDFEHVYKNHIEPSFGSMKISKIDKRNIMEWQANLEKQNYSYKTKSKLRGLLSTILKFGVMYYDLPFNLVQKVESFRNLETKQEMQVWSEKEFKSFLAIIDEQLYKTFFAFLYMTGCRKGEAFALKWEDINFNTNTLTINKSLTRKVYDKAFEITTPKNQSSNRKILLPTSLINQLAVYKAYASPLDTYFIFGGVAPLAENTVTRRLKFYCEKSGVKLIRMHDFRHSHASFLISKNINVVLIAKRLGHSNIEQTLNTYSHLMPDDEINMVKILDIDI